MHSGRGSPSRSGTRRRSRAMAHPGRFFSAAARACWWPVAIRPCGCPGCNCPAASRWPLPICTTPGATSSYPASAWKTAGESAPGCRQRAGAGHGRQGVAGYQPAPSAGPGRPAGSGPGAGAGLRHRTLVLPLQGLAEQLLQKPLKAADRDIHALLLVGIYQLLYTRIPGHAAISETVDAAVRLKKAWAKGLLNAVLRRVQREGNELLAQLERDPVIRTAHPRWLQKRLKAD